MITEIKRQKINARALTRYYIRTGRLQKRPCDVCRKREKIEAHHVSYDNPFAIRWLCRACHVDQHLELRYPNTIRKQLAFKLTKQLSLI